MEVYDPELETWDTLPNPPVYTELVDDLIDAHLVLEGKNYILVNRPSLGGEFNEEGPVDYLWCNEAVLESPASSQVFLFPKMDRIFSI